MQDQTDEENLENVKRIALGTDGRYSDQERKVALDLLNYCKEVAPPILGRGKSERTERVKEVQFKNPLVPPSVFDELINEQLYITHPDPKFDQRQEEELTKVTGEAKTFMLRMFVLGNTSMRYYRQLQEAPTEQDVEQWLDGLSGEIAAFF